MAYYPPFQHPTTLPLPATLPLHLHQQRQHYRQAQIATRHSKEAALAHQHFTRSLLINERAQHDLIRNYEQDRQAAESAESAIEYNYMRKIEKLRKEREMLQNPGMLRGQLGGLGMVSDHRDDRFMSDEELIRLYESGSREKEYRQELLAQLGQRNRREEKGEDRLKDQKHPQPEGEHPYSKSRQPQSLRKKQRQEDEFVKRSYIDELNNTSDSAFRRSRPDFDKAQTIDVFANTSGSPFKPYPPKTKGRKGNKAGSKTINHSLVRDKPRQPSSSSRREQPSAAITGPAMKKINNRLRVAEIVYKDSKLRHDKHEAEHLVNTFEIEARMRKEVRNKINNNPDILKKHLLVAASR